MLKNEEIRQKYLFLKKGLNDFEAEWIMFDCIHKVRKKSKKTIVTLRTIECQKLISHSITSEAEHPVCPTFSWSEPFYKTLEIEQKSHIWTEKANSEQD